MKNNQEFKINYNLQDIKFNSINKGSVKEIEKEIDKVLPILKQNFKKVRDDFYNKRNIIEEKSEVFFLSIKVMDKIEKFRTKGHDSIFVISILEEFEDIVNSSTNFKTLETDINEMYINFNDIYEKTLKIDASTMIIRNFDSINESDRLKQQNIYLLDLIAYNSLFENWIEETKKKRIQERVNIIYSKENQILKFISKTKGLED
jgi:hypothetical protein